MSEQIGVGTRIGDYNVTGLLGKGGMGMVYRAEDLRTSEPVALKVLAAELAENQAFIERFLREAEYAASVQHAHVVRVLASGRADGHVFMAQQIVEGTDLKALLALEGSLDAARALSILGQVAEALDAVHDAGLLHRDVKPANVLIGDGGDVYLTDFGLSKHPTADTHALTAAGEFVGTLYYAAPEQVLGKEVGPEADVYSFGCVLYECLTGERPFLGERAAELLDAHIEDPPPKVITKRPDLNPAIDEVIAVAMAKQPKERFARATVVVEAARTALGVAPPPMPAPAAPAPAPAAPAPTPAAEAAVAVDLVVTVGPALDTELRVEEELELGRSAEGAGNLAGDAELSRRHALIRREGGKFVIHDLGSMNGTFVNGQQLDAPYAVSVGDTIEVGGTRLLVRAIEVEATPSLRTPEPEPARRRPATSCGPPPASASAARALAACGRPNAGAGARVSGPTVAPDRDRLRSG